MMRIRQITAGLAALAVTASLVVGVPYLLVTAVGWPGPTVWPTFDQLTGAHRAGISDTTIIKLLAVIIWAGWGQLTLALAAETLAAIRGRSGRRVRLTRLQPLAARLVAAILLLAPTPALARPEPAGLDTLPPAAMATMPHNHAAAGGADAVVPPPSAANPATTTVQVTVGPRDSWWRLAETHLGDGLRWRELRHFNLGRPVTGGTTTIDVDTDRLEPGWQILVPANLQPATDRDAGGERSPTDGDGKGGAGEWQVRPGDHFWGIATTTLTDAWGRPPDNREIVGYWQQLIDTNRDRLAPPGDPDLIYPDQRFLVPAPPPDPHTTDTGTDGDGQPTSEPDPAPDRHDPVPADPEADPPPPAADTPEPATRPPAGQDGWKDALEGRDTPHADPTVPADRNSRHITPDRHETTDGRVDHDDGAEAEGRSALGVPAGLTAGVAATSLAAAGILALWRWRRRTALTRRQPGLELPTPLPETATQNAKLTAAEPDGQALDSLAGLLTTIPPDVHPVIVRVDDDGHIVLLFDDNDQLPDPPPPWKLTENAGQPSGWVATLGSDGPERSVGLPLLATLGRNGRSILVANLAAMRTLHLAGPDVAVRRRLHAITLEVATSRLAVPVQIVVAGDGQPQFASLKDIRHSDDLTVEIDQADAEIDRDVAVDDRTPRLLVCHPNTRPPHIPSRLRGLVGAVTATPPDTPSWQLDIDHGNGRLTLPDGSHLDLTLPDLDPTLIGDELDRLDPHPNGQPTRPDHTDTADTDTAETAAVDRHPATTAAASPNGQARAPARQTVEPAWCEVRLLGPVDVIRDGHRIDDGLTPQRLEILAYLATHRDHGVAKGELDNAVWAGHRPAPGSQRVTASLTKLRTTLGDGPDGQPLLPPRVGTGPIRLSDHVGCDIDRALAHLAAARDLPADLATHEILAALELVRGQPFHDLPVSWATDITQPVIVRLQDAALETARSLREAGDYDTADTVIRRALPLHDPNDALYFELARIAADAGHPEHIQTIWQQLRQRHADDTDDRLDITSTPAPEIEAAFHQLAAQTGQTVDAHTPD